MPLLRFEHHNIQYWGELVADTIYVTDGLAGTRNGEQFARADVRLLAPATPSKIVCVGRNYLDHIKELGNMLGNDLPKEPGLFLKAPNTLAAPGSLLSYPSWCQELHYEGELALIIGKKAQNVQPENALEHVLGYTIALDYTARDRQKTDLQWFRAKSADGFCPLGPWIVPNLDPQSLHIQTRINGQVRQDAPTSYMIFSVIDILCYVSQFMTLEAGDVILTGTPQGVGAVQAGDRIEIEISGIGTLSAGVQ